jgi:hypothetical protein
MLRNAFSSSSGKEIYGVGDGEVIKGNGSLWGRFLSISIPESPFGIGNGQKLNYLRARPTF